MVLSPTLSSAKAGVVRSATACFRRFRQSASKFLLPSSSQLTSDNHRPTCWKLQGEGRSNFEQRKGGGTLDGVASYLGDGVDLAQCTCVSIQCLFTGDRWASHPTSSRSWAVPRSGFLSKLAAGTGRPSSTKLGRPRAHSRIHDAQFLSLIHHSLTFRMPAPVSEHNLSQAAYATRR